MYTNYVAPIFFVSNVYIMYVAIETQTKASFSLPGFFILNEVKAVPRTPNCLARLFSPHGGPFEIIVIISKRKKIFDFRIRSWRNLWPEFTRIKKRFTTSACCRFRYAHVSSCSPKCMNFCWWMDKFMLELIVRTPWSRPQYYEYLTQAIFDNDNMLSALPAS